MPAGQRTAVSKHLVLATGIGSQKPNMPQIADRGLYQGISVHSAQYQNAKQLVEKGVKVGKHTMKLEMSRNAHHDLVCPRDWIRQHGLRRARGLPRCWSSTNNECPLFHLHHPRRLCLRQNESWSIRLWSRCSRQAFLDITDKRRRPARPRAVRDVCIQGAEAV